MLDQQLTSDTAGEPARIFQMGLHHYGFWVDDLDPILARFEGAGVHILLNGAAGADSVWWGEPPGDTIRSLIVQDPEGCYVQFDQRVAADGRSRQAEPRRAGANAATSNAGRRSATRSATIRPLTGPSSRPLAPWPVATCTLPTSGSGPSTGRSSSLTGRSPTRTSRNVASARPGLTRRPSENSWRSPAAVARGVEPDVLDGRAERDRPSSHGTT